MVEVDDNVASSISEYLETRGQDDLVIKPIPIHHRRLKRLFGDDTPSIVVRDTTPATTAATASDATISCGPNDTTGACERQAVSNTERTTVPVVLGVLLPLTVALILFAILHRRYVKNLRKEDAEDRYKSLDFGTDEVVIKHGKKSMEMSMTETKEVLRKDRGLSMEIHMNTPYLLPPELNQSRESLRSLTKSLPDDDKYRTTDFIPDDGSIRPPSSIRHYGDEGSSLAGSSRRRFDAESTKTLVRNAQASPLSAPPTRRASLVHGVKNIGVVSPPPVRSIESSTPESLELPSRSNIPQHGPSMSVATISSVQHVVNVVHPGPTRAESMSPTREVVSEQSTPMIPEIQEPSPIMPTGDFDFQLSTHDNTRLDDPPLSMTSTPVTAPTTNVLAVPDFSKMRPDSSYVDDEIPVAARPASHFNGENVPALLRKESPIPEEPVSIQNQPETDYWNYHGSGLNGAPKDVELFRESVLPQLDVYDSQGVKQPPVEKESPAQVSDTSSQTSTPSLGFTTTISPQPQSQVDSAVNTPKVEERFSIYEDYYDEDEVLPQNDYAGATGYDSNRMSMGIRPLPYDDPAENPEQRANRIRSFYKEYFDETKPAAPQGPVFYYDGSEAHYDNVPPMMAPQGRAGYPAPRVQSQMRRPAQHRATISNGSYMSGSRIQSGMSSQFGYGPKKPKKNLPPPKPLSLLPTPHKLREDSALFLASDFAPPDLAKLQRSGTPDSLRGGKRAYTPSIRSHVPLASSFDDISVIPSPHALRDESSYTPLDFAPPPRIRGRESRANSDSGSIRSNRSGLSAMHQYNIRSGAYQVSRIPKDVAGTRNELAQALKPKWDMNR